jgi:hypothetical protein
MDGSTRGAFSRLVSVFALATVAAAGCTTPCDQIARQRQALLDRAAPPDGAPHAVAWIPLAVANDILAPRVREVDAIPMEVPGAGLLGPYLRGLTVQPRAMRLEPTSGSGVGLALDLDVIQDARPLFSLAARGAIEPSYDPATRRVVVELRPADFTSVTPSLAPDAIARLTAALERAIPSVARLLLPGPVITAGAAMVGETVLASSFPMIRERLLARLGPIARVEVSLPDLPVERIVTSTRPGDGGGALRIARGVAPDTAPPSRPGAAATLLLSGQTVAEYANWAMSDGRLPARFDEHGRGAADGMYRAHLAWETGDRPLRVHVFRLEGQCLRALLSATPGLRVQGERIVLEVDEVHVDELEGPSWAGLARLFSGIWLGALERTQSIAGTLELSVGDRPVRARVTDVTRTGDLVDLALAFDP